MNITQSNTPIQNPSPLKSNNQINNEQSIVNQNDKIQMFNKIYDSTFLIMINELSISIQNFHKSYINQSNIIKSIFNEIENEKILKIKNEISQMDLLSSKFYSDAKIIFKKMKLYRNNKIKNINQTSLNTKHKKSSSINSTLEISNVLSNIDNNIRYNNTSIFKNNDF